MLSFVVALMVILICSYWAFQGLFSSMIMFVEVTIAMMVGIGFYKPLSNHFADTFNPEVGEPGLMMVLFFVSLGFMRVLTDKYITRNIRVQPQFDRVGGGVFGLFTALVMIGMALLSIQMMPIGKTLFGFDRYSPNRDGRLTRNTIGMGFNPDGFVVGYASLLGNGRFTWQDDDRSFSRVNPDMIDDLYYRRTAPLTQVRLVLPDDSLKIRGVRFVDTINKLTVTKDDKTFKRDTSEVVKPKDSNATYMVVDVSISQEAHERGKLFMLFTPAQFRLVGPRPKAGSRSNMQVIPAVGLSDIYITPKFNDTGADKKRKTISRQQAATLVMMDRDTPLTLDTEAHEALMDDAEGKGYEISVVFEVPDAEFDPWYIEFKSGARAEIKLNADDNAATGRNTNSGSNSSSSGNNNSGNNNSSSSGNSGNNSESGTTPANNTPVSDNNDSTSSTDNSGADASTTNGGDDVTVGPARGGRVHLANAIKDRTGTYATLPVALPRDAVSRYLRSGKVFELHTVLDVPSEEELKGSNLVTEFFVPEGKKLVQVGSEQVHARSFLGRPLALAKDVLGQIFLETGTGEKYFAIGSYTVAVIDGRLQMEIQYWPEAMVPERALQAAKKFNRSVMSTMRDGDYKYGLLFLVDPGAQITHFRTDSRGGGQELSIQVPS